jgi:hypothetical protein
VYESDVHLLRPLDVGLVDVALAVAVPLTTLLPVKAMFVQSVREVSASASGAGPFSTGKDSSVRADWFRKKSFAVNMRESAGIMSPALKCRTSPGTTSVNLMSFFPPSLRAVQVETSFERRSSAAW